MDQAVDGGGREHQAAAEVADERDMIRLGAVGRNHHEDPDDKGDVEDQGPVGVEWKADGQLDVREDCRDEGYYPCELRSAASAGQPPIEGLQQLEAYRGN